MVQRLIRGLLLTFACGWACVAPCPAAHAEGRPVKIVALGNSLTAGLGLPADAAFPARLAAALRQRGIEVEMVNAGVSGDTASGGLARLDWSVPPDTDAVILELGANDALRGIDPKLTRAALQGIVQKLHERGIPVLLCGMRAPPNMGPDYAKAFDAIYPAIAEAPDVILYPFFLDGVAARPELNQADGMHPNAAGVAVVVERLRAKAEELVAVAKARRGH